MDVTRHHASNNTLLLYSSIVDVCGIFPIDSYTHINTNKTRAGRISHVHVYKLYIYLGVCVHGYGEKMRFLSFSVGGSKL